MKGVICVVFSIFVVLSCSSPLSSALSVLHNRNVFTCGFGEALHFATNFLQSHHLHRHKHVHNIPFQNASRADVMVVYGNMEHCQVVCSYFNGLIIFIDSEAGRPVVSSYLSNFTEQNLANMIYLGVPSIKLPPTVEKIPCIYGTQTLEYSLQTLKKTLSRHTVPAHKFRFLAYAASKCLPFRERVFDMLVNLSVVNNLGAVTAYGLCHGSHQNANYSLAHVIKTNRSNYPRLSDSSRKHLWNNGVLFRPYKYVLAMENDDVDYYITEKIFFAYQSGAIPLYWGASRIIHDIFHPSTFIYIDPNNIESALDRILQIESDPNLYSEILKTPILLNGEETINKYFAVGIPASSASNPQLYNASLSNRIWEAIIRHLKPLPNLTRLN